MGIPRENILNLNKSRMRAIFWRQDSQGDWVETRPLPADPASMNYYFLKGFKGKKPEQLTVEGGTVSCPDCGFEAKSNFGLKAHQRKHKSK